MSEYEGISLGELRQMIQHEIDVMRRMLDELERRVAVRMAEDVLDRVPDVPPDPGDEMPTSVIKHPGIMSGEPTVSGTRVPAMTIVAYLRAGRTAEELFLDYPTLPVDGIDAVVVWAEAELGPDWRDQQ